ncbi:fibronectin type III domain-containing protein [Xylanibacillus composti]|nr:hypothetical protein [Xylanibacillus composti]
MANLPPPQVSGVIYNQNANRIQVNWQPSDGQFYVIALFTGDKQLEEKRVIGFGGELIPSMRLEPNTLYQVKVAQTDGPGGPPGPFGPAVDLITESLQGLQAVNDGDTLEVRWELPKLGNVSGGKVIIMDKSSGRPVHTEQLSGNGGSFSVAGLWIEGRLYSIILYPTKGISQGPASPELPLVQQVPICNAIGYEISPDGKLSIVKAGCNPPLPEDTMVELTLYEGDAAKAKNKASSTSITIELGHVLDPSYRYAGTLRYWSGSSAGPESPREPVLVVPPSIERVAHEAGFAHITWRYLPIEPIPVYGKAALIQGNTSIAQATILGNTASLALPDRLDPDAQYEVRVLGLLGKSRSPVSDKVPFLAEERQIGAVLYNGKTLSVAWPGEPMPGVNDYEIQIWNEGVRLSSTTCRANVNRAEIPLELDPLAAYQVRLRPVGDRSWGKPGPGVDIISAVPGATSIETDADRIAVQVAEPAAKPGVAGYIGYLYEGDKLLAKTAASRTDGTGGYTVVFPRKGAGYEVKEGSAYAVKLQAVGEQPEARSGPLSEAYPVIVSVLRMTSVVYDRAASQVAVRWEPSRESAVSGYVVLVADSEGQTTTLTSSSEAVVALPAGRGGTVMVIARSALSRGPAGATVRVLTETVAVSRTSYADGFLYVAWQSVSTERPVYRVEVLAGSGEVVHSAASGSAEALLGVALQASGTYSVRVTVVSGVAVGAPGEAASIISAVPGASSIETDADRIVVQVAEPEAKPGVAGYLGYLYEGDKLLAKPVAAQTDGAGGYTVVFPRKGEGYEVKEGLAYAVKLQAVGEQPEARSGPLSEAYLVVVSVPRITEASINGYAWRLCWTASLEPAIRGYVVTVTDANGGHPLTFYTTDTSYAGNQQFADNQTLATVQAIGEVASGPVSAAVHLYGDGASYYVSQASGEQPAYVYRSDQRPPGSQDIRLYVPDVFNAQPGIDSDVFVWTRPDDAPPNYPYLLTVAESGPAWKFDAQSRNALWEAYDRLLQQLDPSADEGGGDGSVPLLKPGAFLMLRQAIARSLPLLFTEQLQYAYGFNPANGYVDLVPGMRLRLDAEARQFVGAPSPVTDKLNGFVPSGTQWVAIGEYWQANSVLTGFDAFLSRCERPSVPAPQAAGGAGGSIDLYSENGGRRRLYRLLYPQSFPESSSMGNADRTDHILILGADCYADLAGATAQYVSMGNFDGYEDKIIVNYFRGRAVLVPEIPIAVNGQTCYVSVGSTLRDVAAQFGGAWHPANQFLAGWNMERSTANIIGTAAEARAAVQTQSYAKIRLDDYPLQPYEQDRSCYDLPLLHGDRIWLHTEAGSRAGAGTGANRGGLSHE